MIEEWLLGNDMDNIGMAILNDHEMIGIWWINWKLITKWPMYNDIGNVDQLSTYLPTYSPSHPTYHLFPYLATHPPTYLPMS
jgi:hypothetical protein